MTRPYQELLADGTRVLIDSNPLIYVLEGGPLAAAFLGVFADIERGRLVGVATPVTLAETMVGPLSSGNEIAAERFRIALCENANIEFRAADEHVAIATARVRAGNRLRLPDAMQLASALVFGCDALLTHDRGFRGVAGLTILGQDANERASKH